MIEKTEGMHMTLNDQIRDKERIVMKNERDYRLAKTFLRRPKTFGTFN